MTTNKPLWRVYVVFETKDATGQIAGGDDELIKSLQSEKQAVSYGNKLSMKATHNKQKVHCVWISYMNEEEDEHTTIFITKGKVTNRTTG